MNLAGFVSQHAKRGACICGRCIDALANPEEHQPDGHTADVMFFKVAQTDGPEPETFRALVEKEYPHWLDGEEHNYLEMGADIGDQGIALVTMGLGHLLEIWQLHTPRSMMPSLPEDMQQQMAGMGMIIIRAS